MACLFHRWKSDPFVRSYLVAICIFLRPLSEESAASKDILISEVSQAWWNSTAEYWWGSRYHSRLSLVYTLDFAPHSFGNGLVHIKAIGDLYANTLFHWVRADCNFRQFPRQSVINANFRPIMREKYEIRRLSLYPCLNLRSKIVVIGPAQELGLSLLSRREVRHDGCPDTIAASKPRHNILRRSNVVHDLLFWAASISIVNLVAHSLFNLQQVNYYQKYCK